MYDLGKLKFFKYCNSVSSKFSWCFRRSREVRMECRLVHHRCLRTRPTQTCCRGCRTGGSEACWGPSWLDIYLEIVIKYKEDVYFVINLSNHCITVQRERHRRRPLPNSSLLLSRQSIWLGSVSPYDCWFEIQLQYLLPIGRLGRRWDYTYSFAKPPH